MNNKFTDFNLDKDIIKGLNNLEYNEPSKVQKEVIPKLLDDKDIIVKSKTGSGKTASFAIPICQNIDIQKNYVQALIVVPTRELALQVKQEISSIGRIKKIRCIEIYGKQPIKEQIQSLKQRIHVVVATPGRIIDHIQRKTINIENINYLIIDEADKMMSTGFIEQMNIIFENIKNDKTIGLFSATIDEDIKNISKKYMKDSEIIEIEQTEKVCKKQIEEKYISVNKVHKYEVLKKLIYVKNPKSLIIFANTRENVSRIYEKLKKDKFSVKQIHGEISQDKRIYAIKDFKEKKFNILVSSDVAARGIHIDDISLVINYDVPKDKENYVHRIGRTGRKDKFGEAITLVDDKEVKFISEIQNYIEYKIDEISDIDYMNQEDINILKAKYQNEIVTTKRTKKINNNDKSSNEVTKLYLNAGKKKKIRVLDIVGAINNLEGINSEDIGVIEVNDLCSYVDILNYKGNKLLKKYKEINIKKKPVKIKKDNQNN